VYSTGSTQTSALGGGGGSLQGSWVPVTVLEPAAQVNPSSSAVQFAGDQLRVTVAGQDKKSKHRRELIDLAFVGTGAAGIGGLVLHERMRRAGAAKRTKSEDAAPPRIAANADGAASRGAASTGGRSDRESSHKLAHPVTSIFSAGPELRGEIARFAVGTTVLPFFLNFLMTEFGG